MKSNRSVNLVFGMVIFAFVFTLALGAGTAMAADKEDAQGLVDKANVTLNGFLRDESYSWIRDNLGRAKGVLIYPQVLKAGFILGGSGGTGVFIAKDAKGEWSQPAFYTLGSVSFGLQIGGEAAEVIVMCMTQKAVDALMTTSAKLGADTSLALGPVGGGAKSQCDGRLHLLCQVKGALCGPQSRWLRRGC